MKLTKDTVIGFKDGGNTNIYLSDIELCEQILDDYEKARQLDRFTESNLPSLMNFKLRELIEREIESGQDGRIQSSLLFLQNLLEESKK